MSAQDQQSPVLIFETEYPEPLSLNDKKLIKQAIVTNSLFVNYIDTERVKQALDEMMNEALRTSASMEFETLLAPASSTHKTQKVALPKNQTSDPKKKSSSKKTHK
jgi:uncharacterized membrane protein affecting hemolysin expression